VYHNLAVCLSNSLAVGCSEKISELYRGLNDGLLKHFEENMQFDGNCDTYQMMTWKLVGNLAHG
uniref:Uncharacterized protein n=1 Tax=Romanomermis culicivorax TaxID=13658 RepID=A0A915K5Z3_ROMCU